MYRDKSQCCLSCRWWFYLFQVRVVINLSLLGLFIPTFLFVSITPGMCMTLALTVGISQGVRRALWMMLGELLGVALVATGSGRMANSHLGLPLTLQM